MCSYLVTFLRYIPTGTSNTGWIGKWEICTSRSISVSQLTTLDGCIVWNAHDTVFDSKRSAVCVLAVFFVHSTRPKIEGLVSRDCDSIVGRHFVTAWVREWVANIRFMCRAVPSTVVWRRRKFWGRFLVRSVHSRGMTELIPTVIKSLARGLTVIAASTHGFLRHTCNHNRNFGNLEAPWPWPWIGSRSHQHAQYL